MACPYFIPEQRCERELWTHRARLPLGDGYAGKCSSPGNEAVPSDEQLRGCNLGNARCERLPQDRAADAVRFHVSGDSDGALTVLYSVEREHRPAGNGILTWDMATKGFKTHAAAENVARLASAFVQSHLHRHPRNQTD